MKNRDISAHIIAGLISGDHEAFEHIFIHLREPIFRFLVTLTRSDEVADDITQEVFIKLWESRDKVDQDKNIKGFLYRIARNSVLDHFDKQNVRQKYIQHISLSPAEGISQDEIMIASEMELLVDIAVQRMPEVRRRVYKLSREEGLTNDEIAQKLNLTAGNVRSHLHNAIKDIREIFVVFLAFAAIND